MIVIVPFRLPSVIRDELRAGQEAPYEVLKEFMVLFTCSGLADLFLPVLAFRFCGMSAQGDEIEFLDDVDRGTASGNQLLQAPVGGPDAGIEQCPVEQMELLRKTTQ